MPFSQSKGSTLTDSSEFSSFEELNAITEEGRPDRSAAAAAADEETRPLANNNERTFTPSTRVITRRRSDGSLHSKCLADEPTECGPSTKSNRKQSCTRCGRKKNELKRRLKRFHDQLTELSTQDGEIQEHLEAILLYLERKRISVLSNEDSNDEEEEQGDSRREPGAGRINNRRRSSVIVTQPRANPEIFGDSGAAVAAGDDEEGGGEEDDKPKVVYKRRFVKLDDIQSR